MELRKYFLFLKVSPVKADPSHTHSVGAVLVKYRELCPRGSEVLKSMPWELPTWKDPWKDSVCCARHYFTNGGQTGWELCVFKSQNPPSAVTCTYQEDAWRGLRAQQLTAPLPLILRYWFFEGTRKWNLCAYLYKRTNDLSLCPKAVTHILKCKEVKDTRQVSARHCDRTF